MKNEREHLNAIIKLITEKAERIDHLHTMRQQGSLLYDKTAQKEVIAEELEFSLELKVKIDELINILEKELKEEIEVID